MCGLGTKKGLPLQMTSRSSTRSLYQPPGTILEQFFGFFFFFKIYFIVHLFVCVPSEARRHPIPRSWSYKWLWTNQSGCWEPDLGPPLLPAEPSLQPCIFFLHTFLEKHMYMFITRTEEMAQLLRTQTALPGDWSLIPNTPISWLTTTFNSSGFHRP